MEDAHEEIRRVISKDLVAWSRRGDDERLTGVVEAVADIMLELGAGKQAEARTLISKLLAWRDTFYDAELAEARHQSRPHGKLDGDTRRGSLRVSNSTEIS